MISVSDIEKGLSSDNWDNPRNFDPEKIAEAETALKKLREAIQK